MTVSKNLQKQTKFHSDQSVVQRTEQSEESIHIWAWINQGHFSEKTKEVYVRIIKDFMSEFWSLPLKAITPAVVTVFLRKKHDLAAATRNLYRNALSSLFQYLENIGYINKNPVKATRQEKSVDTFYYKILSESQVAKMLKISTSERDSLIILCLYYTGLRVSELNQVRVLDFAPHRKAVQKGAYLTVKGKGGKIRTIMTGSHLWKKIKLFIKRNKINKNGYLFSYDQNPLSRIRIFKIVKTLTEKAKIKTPGSKSPSPHWFRHTSAIHALENGADIHIVQSTLGHASLATTGKYLRSRPLKSNSSYLKKI